MTIVLLRNTWQPSQLLLWKGCSIFLGVVALVDIVVLCRSFAPKECCCFCGGRGYRGCRCSWSVAVFSSWRNSFESLSEAPLSSFGWSAELINERAECLPTVASSSMQEGAICDSSNLLGIHSSSVLLLYSFIVMVMGIFQSSVSSVLKKKPHLWRGSPQVARRFIHSTVEKW